MDPICYLDPMRSTDMLAGASSATVDALLVAALVIAAALAFSWLRGR